MRSSLSSKGRVGVIVPTGIATDDTTKHFFSDVVNSHNLVSLFDFRNEGFFPDVASAQGVRFCLLTIEGSGGHESVDLLFRATTLTDLVDENRRLQLRAADFALVNPNTRTCPVFLTARDARLATSVYRRLPILVREAESTESPWGASFRQGIFNMSSDSSVFRTKEQLESDGLHQIGNRFTGARGEYWPLYEAKMFREFDHRFGDYAAAHWTGGEVRQLPRPSLEQIQDPAWLPEPRYWVPAVSVVEVVPSSWFAVFRDVTSSLDQRTAIVGAIPPAGVGHTAPLLQSSRPERMFLVAMAQSVVFDYFCRLKLGGTHLTFTVFKQLPVLPPPVANAAVPWHIAVTARDWVRDRVLELTYTAWDLEAFANELGYYGPPFKWHEERRALLRAELDACFFRLYGIERDDVDYILGTFPIVNRKDREKYGEERTRRLILERYDALAEATASGVPYQTVLDPPPADPSVAHPESTRPDWAMPPASARG
jgi:hypothetical protein